MACYTSFVNVIAGQWVQLCEYRPGRRALIIDVQNCSLILNFSAQVTQTQSAAGVSPPGLLISPNTGNGRTIFRLHADDDADLVEQAWYAWAIGGTILPPVIHTDTFTSNGTWQGPFGVTQADIVVLGQGGNTFAASAGLGASCGGGGGARAETPAFTIIPGFTYTINCPAPAVLAPLSQAPVTWFSNTGSPPLSLAQGVLAQGGFSPAVAGTNTPGQGGPAGSCIGSVTAAGASGGTIGAFVPGGGQSGGGGGGHATATLAATPGGNGAPGSNPVSAGGVTDGGTGGGSSSPAIITGTSGNNGGGAGGSGVTPAGVTGAAVAQLAGIVAITYTVFTGNAVTVMESYNVPAFDPESGYVNPYVLPRVVMPPLTPAQRWQFAQLLKKWCQRT